MPKATEIAAELQAKADQVKAAASPYVAEAEAEARELRGRLDGLKQAAASFRYDPPAVGWKATAALFLALCAGAVLSYYAGKRVERHWWRNEIAAKSAAAKTVMTQLGHDAPELDARLTAALGDDREKLERSERMLREVQARPPVVVQAPAAPADRCRPLPADCLRN